jgi:hypothetical protein
VSYCGAPRAKTRLYCRVLMHLRTLIFIAETDAQEPPDINPDHGQIILLPTMS